MRKINCASDADVIQGRYFFFGEAKPGCHDTVFWLGAAAIALIFSFFGFLDSRLLLCSPLAISLSLCFDTELNANIVSAVRLAQDAGEVSSAIMARSRASITV